MQRWIDIEMTVKDHNIGFAFKSSPRCVKIDVTINIVASQRAHCPKPPLSTQTACPVRVLDAMRCSIME